MSFSGPEGAYTVYFRPIDDWDGIIEVSIGGHSMQWLVVHADREDSGQIVLGGMTDGTEDIWNGYFWFELRIGDIPPVIRYWGDKVIWREDKAV